MRFSLRRSSALRVAATLAVVSFCVVSVALARPRPRKPGGFRLFSSASELVATNRVQCNIFASGQLCYAGSSTVGAGIWPKGTADGYNFAGGLQIGGEVDNALPKTANAFSGDTAGAFFYNTGFTSNGRAVRPIFSSQNADDAAAWPDEALVPIGDASENIYDPTLRGQIAASQGDRWFLSWEGDASDLAARTHPLGIAVETRMLNWNFPSGNQDIIYFVFTFYNVTTSDDAPYAAIRPSLRQIIADQGKTFVATNSAKFGPLPTAGYTIKNIFVDVVNDMDVADFNLNFAAVNLPFNLGYAYQADFSERTARDRGWSFDPSIFGSAPFFNGPGFVGVKFLLSPINPLTGTEVGLSQFNVFTNGGTLSDPNDDKQLYRYMTGNLLPSDGSGCNAPPGSKICAIDLNAPTDVRFLQASGPFDLAPGQFASIVVAYIYAAPVANGNCPGVGCNVPPADGGLASRLTILGDPAKMNAGVNQIDKITGYLGFSNAGPTDTDPTKVTQEEFQVVPKSLLDKALVAQTVFNNKFLLPFSPERPEFFLVPGDNQVTVLWGRSSTETVPDPFFVIASQPLNADGTVNPLYDPNFRGTDVEGYRVYRGRTSNPSELTLLAQFDYAPDTTNGQGLFPDFRAMVNPTTFCAPEIDVFVDCPAAFGPPPLPGQPFTVADTVDLVGTITQIVPGNRVKLADGTAQVLPGLQDTAFADIAAGRLASGVSTNLTNSGVPFLYVDHNVRNSLRYFYVVTAFDVNSAKSGPSSLESARVAKAVTPTRPATNLAATATVTNTIIGRDVPLTSTAIPTLDPATGEFSGPFPPADQAVVQFAGGLNTQLVSAGSSRVRLDGIGLGDARDGIPAHYTFTSLSPADTVQFSVDIDPAFAQATTVDTSPSFPAALTDPALGVKFEGVASAAPVPGEVAFGFPNYQQIQAQDRGCFDGSFTAAAGTTGCFYNGPRWFAGDNETQPDPNAGMATDGSGAVPTGFSLNNAGALPGVTTIFTPMSAGNVSGDWRGMDAALGGAARAADFKVYWGNPGKIDSIIDVTHNVPVPFLRDSIGGGFGVLNVSGSNTAGSDDGQTGVVTINDLSCVEPIRSGAAGTGAQGLWPVGCTSAAPFFLSDSAELNPVGIYTGGLDAAATVAPAANPGFLLYIAGRISVFELAGATLPSATVWTLRTYSGWVSGGNGAGGSLGPYTFTPGPRPFTAIGAEIELQYNVVAGVNPVAANDLSRVHTVPDPYYVQSKFEASTDQKVLKFVGLPQDCIIRIYSVSGVLVRVLEHHSGNYSSRSTAQGSEHDWDLRNRNNQVVASGVYFWHVEAGDARKVGRFTLVNFAQ